MNTKTISRILLGTALALVSHTGFSDTLHITALRYNISASPNSPISTLSCQAWPKVFKFAIAHYDTISAASHLQGKRLDEHELMEMYAPLSSEQTQALGMMPETVTLNKKSYHTTTIFSYVQPKDGSYFAKGLWWNQYCQGQVLMVKDELNSKQALVTS